MGTKVQYSINLLATSVDRNNLTLSGVDVWELYYQNNNCQRSGTNKLQDPMDRLLDRNDIESIRKTMQMHEDIFKHQVRELHRVYSVQKLLMDDLRKQIRLQKKFQTSLNGIDANHPQIFIGQQHNKTTQISFGSDNFNVQSMRELDLGTRKMSTESCSGDTIKIQRGLFDLEKPAEEGDIIFTRASDFDEGEAGPSSYTSATFQSCKATSIIDGGYDYDEEIDLTLSIGGSQVKKMACLDSPNNGKTTRELNSPAGESSDPTTPSTVALTQEIREGPHWLSQGLRLN